MTRFFPAALLALALPVSGCLPVRVRPAGASPMPGLQVSVDEAFYRIGGVTAPRLNVELSKRGPRHEGARWQGLTAFRMVYSYQPDPAPGGCRAAEPKVTVRVVTTLPLWKDREAAPLPLRSDWDLYLGRLREHEQGHQRIAIVAGEALLEDVAALQAPDCDALRLSVVALVEAHRASLARDQQGWDEETAHGLSGD